METTVTDYGRFVRAETATGRAAPRWTECRQWADIWRLDSGMSALAL